MRTRGAMIAALVLVVAGLAATGAGAGAAGDPVIAAAGDIACSPANPRWHGGVGDATHCQEKATSDLVLSLGATAVLPLGDEQYVTGSANDFAASYAPTWGRLRAVSRPVPGNHEYQTPGAVGYFGYFGGAAGDSATGWYSYDIGAWHLIALNGNCPQIGGCGAGSAEERWLAQDLVAHSNTCTLAYWHQPRFASTTTRGTFGYAALWKDLYAARADVVLNGHHHFYERFAPMTPTGARDAVRGIREFVVGTGGADQEQPGAPSANSEALATGFGVLTMTLHAGTYDWRFRTVDGRDTDSGSAACH